MDEESPRLFTSSGWAKLMLSEEQLIAGLVCNTIIQADSVQQTGSEVGQTSNSTFMTNLLDCD